MTTATKKVSFQERLRRGLRKLDAKGWDLRTVSAVEIIATARGLVRSKSKTEQTKQLKAFDDAAEKTSAPVQVSIAKRNYKEDGTGCEPAGEGPGRPSFASLGYGEDAA